MNKVKLENWDVLRTIIKTNRSNMPERFSILSLTLDCVKVGESQERIFFNSRTISPVQNNESDYLEQSVRKLFPCRTFQTTWKKGKDCVYDVKKNLLQGIVDRFSEAYIEVCLPKEKAHTFQYGLLKLSEKFYVALSKVTSEVKEIKFFDLEKMEVVTFDKNEINEGILYGVDNGHCSAIASASDAKYKKFSLYATSGVEGFSNKEWSRRVHHGMYEELLPSIPRNSEGGLKPSKILSQASTRLSQMRAFSKRLASIRKYCVHFGKFEGGSPTPFEYFDGSALFNVRSLTRALNKELESLETPFFVEEDLVLGRGIQARPYSIKSYFTVVKEEVIASAIFRRCKGAYKDGKVEVIELVAEDMSSEQRAAFIAAMNKDKTSPYWGKTVIVAMTKEDVDGDIDFLADMNAFKAPYWPEEESFFNVLELSHGGHGDIKMSAQLCKTLFAANREAAHKLVLERARELTEKKLSALESGSEAHLQDLFGDLGQLAVKLAPSFVLEDSATLYHGQVNNIVEGLSNIINDFNLPLEGEYGAVIPDFSLLFKGGEGLLQFGEVYAPGLVTKDMYEQNVEKRVMLIKYPKMGNHEFMHARAVSKWELIERAEKAMKSHKFSKNSFYLFKDMLYSLKRGICVLPAIPEVMKLLAGLDFDGDKVSIITDEKVIEIVQDFEPIIAAIE